MQIPSAQHSSTYIFLCCLFALLQLRDLNQQAYVYMKELGNCIKIIHHNVIKIGLNAPHNSKLEQ